MSNILKVFTDDIANGPGIRVSVWFAGCSHQCKGCHNPETWKYNQGKDLTFTLIRKIVELCDKPYIRGLTLTGGDPLFIKNREGVSYLCDDFKLKFGNTKDIWCWTGYTWEEIKEDYLIKYNFFDVLVDGRFDLRKKAVNLPYSGSSNQRVIDVRKSLDSGEIVLWQDALKPAKVTKKLFDFQNEALKTQLDMTSLLQKM